MKTLWRTLTVMLLAAGCVACSLLEITLESGIEPLPQEQLNMRVFSRDFTHAFFSRVEHTADRIVVLELSAAQLSERPPDILIESHALMWKIGAEQALQRAIFQASPVAAMLDTWVLTVQMVEFFDTGAGQGLFGDYQHFAVEASRRLAREFERTAKGFQRSDDFERNRAFVARHAADNPIEDLTFARSSAFNDWLAERGISEFEAVTTFGTVPEVMSDISDRMAMITEQTPKILSWKSQLYALHADINVDEIQRTLAEMSATAHRFQLLMAQSPQLMHNLVKELNSELMPLLERLNDIGDVKLAQLATERQALAQLVRNEREALNQMLAQQREAAAGDLDTIAEHTVTVVFKELTKTLKGLILYFILFLLAVFFAPLALGVWLGKRMALRSDP
ncbi:chemotaxis protein [Ferrimonas balearica]|uniref:chemotaxis protein n=1 Tax=Ferrimonas balearica TaxID=44012 RepID=UPI001C993DF2|nr:chemotaxis protein [Ferrimonas balearica]MBY5992426.1 chemotaxis protein [Ferrimonas balearica]